MLPRCCSVAPLLLALAAVRSVDGLRVRPSGSVRRDFLLGAAAAASWQALPAIAEPDEDSVLDPQAAAERIRTEGVLKSTGKAVPLPLIAFIVGGAAAAVALNGPPADDTPLPTGLFSEEAKAAQGLEEKYESSRWTNNVDLPWMSKVEPLEASEEASGTEPPPAE